MAKTKTTSKPAQARIVIDSRDARSDKFIPLADAQKLFAEGKLVEVYIGNAYPNSYERV